MAHLRLTCSVVVAAVVLGCLASGCGGVRTSIRDEDGEVREGTVYGSAAAAARRAANEIPCETERLTVQELDSGGYRISGCGVSITYTCLNNLCSPDERTSDLASSSRSDDVRMGRSRDTWTDDEVRQLFRRIHDPVVGCLPAETDSVRLQLSIDARGAVRRVGASVMSAEANACVDALLARGRMGRQVSNTRFAVLEFRRGSVGISEAVPQIIESTPAPAQAPVPQQPAVGQQAPAPVDPGAAAAVRTAIDARAPALLACVEDQALSLQLSWTAEGRLDARLRGARQGTPDEECVRALVGAMSIPAPGASGTLIHAIQR